MDQTRLARLGRIACAASWLFLSPEVLTAASKPPLLLVYFVPNDREVIPGYVERLDAVMTEVQRFYRDGMNAAGFGALTFDLERDAQHRLAVHEVKGKLPMSSYGRNASDLVRAEVERALAATGLDANQRTVVIFQVLLEWKDGVATEVGPYVGGGSHLAGTAWVYDDALLDPKKLSSLEPGGYYARPCSIGEFNSHYIGGVAHELGHAFGLPHVAGPRLNPKHSLMGDGNHTYGQERRGEGGGTYLHAASALLLARARPFAGSTDSSAASSCDLDTLKAKFADGQLVLDGTVEPASLALGIVAYNDAVRIPADYDAQAAVSMVGASGKFTVKLDELEPGDYELRLQVCQTNGASTTSAFRYRVDSRRVPDLGPFSSSSVVLRRAMRALEEGNEARALAVAAELERGAEGDGEVSRQTRHFRWLLQPRSFRSPTAVPPEERQVHVSDLEFAAASVGWARPLRDRVHVENHSTCFLQVGGVFHERGLYAHAPSRYVLDLRGRWTKFTSGYGLQDGHDGSVVFVVKADGRELFRSARVVQHDERQLALETTGVERLELMVEDGGDGPANDWGVWLEPTLHR